jgi:DNA-binding PadR family transcriptional regulator
MKRYKPAETALRRVTSGGDVFEHQDFILQRGVSYFSLKRLVDARWVVAEPATVLERQMYRLTERGRAALAAMCELLRGWRRRRRNRYVYAVGIVGRALRAVEIVGHRKITTRYHDNSHHRANR